MLTLNILIFTVFTWIFVDRPTLAYRIQFRLYIYIRVVHTVFPFLKSYIHYKVADNIELVYTETATCLCIEYRNHGQALCQH